MFKQIALASTLTITTSFASWDLFPVLENHKGETRVGVQFQSHDDSQALVPYAGTRYTVLPNLELAALVPYYIQLNHNNDNGVLNPEFMVRYQFLENLRAFADITIPATESLYNNTAWQFFFGAQYSQKFGIVDFGSQLGLNIETGGDNKITPPLVVGGVIEADFEFGAPIIPFIGVNAGMEIGKFSKDGHSYGDSHTGHLSATPYAGATYTINQTFNIRATSGVSFGYHVEDDIPFYVDLQLNMFL